MVSWDAVVAWMSANSGQLLTVLAVLAALLIGWAVWSTVRLAQLTRRVRTLFPAGSECLEDMVVALAASLEDVGGRADDALRGVNLVASYLSHSPRHLGLVRFNAFGTGSNLSFSLAMLDDHGTGLVLSSISGREESRIYAKPVQEGSSPHKLTDEEREAIKNARRQYVVQEGDLARGAKE